MIEACVWFRPAKTSTHGACSLLRQVPAVGDGDLTLFESGTIVLHLAEGTALPRNDRRAET